MKTQKISRIEVTLEEGVRYIASRPLYESHRVIYPVFIRRIESKDNAAVINGMGIDDANRFLAEFNNGGQSFEGRVW